jgi:acyl carrier protein
VKTKILVPTNCVRLVTDYLEIDANLVVDEAHLNNDLGVDWLDQIESLIMIEDKFESVQFLDGTAGISFAT